MIKHLSATKFAQMMTLVDLWHYYTKANFGSLHETGSQVSDTGPLVLWFISPVSQGEL